MIVDGSWGLVEGRRMWKGMLEGLPGSGVDGMWQGNEKKLGSRVYGRT